MILAAILLLTISLQRILELRLASRNRLRAMANGGREYGAEHYWMFVVLHVMWLVAMNAEGYMHGFPWSAMSLVGLGGLVVAEIIRYWAIASLGSAWNTRIIVVPGDERVVRGPYKYINHPNYVAVVIELAAVPLIVGAWWTSIVFTLLNAVILLFVRIPAEERALADMKKPLT
ncbi:isoprenylcysteine carboxyl methyltransferase family protein [soil metagenome]